MFSSLCGLCLNSWFDASIPPIINNIVCGKPTSDASQSALKPAALQGLSNCDNIPFLKIEL